MIQALVVGIIAVASANCDFDPVITLNGYTPTILRCNEPYVELGAKANSVCHENLDDYILIDDSAVNTAVPGQYAVIYTVSDLSVPPRTVTKNRIVDVRSDFVFEPVGFNRKPTLQQYEQEIGESLADLYPEYSDELSAITHIYESYWECKLPYDDPGAYAFDDCEGDMTDQIIVLGAEHVLTGEAPAWFPVIYAVLNTPRGNDPEYRIRVVTIVDTTRPTISINGKGYAPGNKQDDGYKPPDDWWWPHCLSVYEEKYPDPQWGSSDLPGFLDIKEEWVGEPMMWYCDKTSYEDPGIVAVDDCEGFLEPAETVVAITRYNHKTNRESFVYVARLGDVDGAFNDGCIIGGNWSAAQLRALRLIRDILWQSFFILDANFDRMLSYDEIIANEDILPTLSQEYFDALDINADGFLSMDELICEENPFPPFFYNPSVYHGYRIYYFMRDSFGNLVFRQTRLVKPQYGIAVIGIEGTTIVNCGDSFSPTEGVIALDPCEGNLTNKIVVTGSVNTAVPGTYELLYTVYNNYGSGGGGTRRIDVVDNTPPQIVLLNESGTPASDPTIDIPWCAWRVRAAGELYGQNWWNSQYWIHPSSDQTDPDGGWVVDEQCDDEARLTGEVRLSGLTGVIEALQFLKDPRSQGIPISVVNTYLKTYNVWHDVTDRNGNKAMPTVRPINIVPTSPKFILNGDIMISQECGDDYLDDGINQILDVLEVDGEGVDACYTGAPGYFQTFYKVVPPGVEPGDVAYLPYVMDPPTPISIDEFVLGDHLVMFRATNPLGYASEITRTIRVGDNKGPLITYDFVNHFGIEDDIYQFDCLNVLDADISEFLSYSATDSCDGDITDEVEYEIVRQEQEDGTGIFTVILSVTDTGKNLTTEETNQFVSISTDMPTLNLGTWAGDTDGPFLLQECASDFVEPDDFAGADGCSADLGSPVSSLVEGDPGVLAWAWALDETGEPLWQETEEDGLQPLAYTYEDFIKMPGEYLLVYTAFDLWNNTYPELNETDDLPPLFDVDGNLSRDASGNLTVDFARLVRIVDRVRPVITLNGESALTINCGIPFVDPGATASDGCDGSLDSAIVVAGDILNISELGPYVLTYNVSDAAGNAAVEKTRTVTVVDTISPTVTLLGNTEVYLECGLDEYEEAGVLASDGCLGDITDMIVIGGDTIDSNLVGDYTITYSATDNDANDTTVSRVVHVVDTTAPVITLLESEIINVECGFEFEEPGYLVQDACTGDLTENVVVSGDAVDTSVFGQYMLTYTVSDATGNIAESTRTVNVVDGTPPVITLPGDNPVTTYWGEPYVEPAGYTALDACDGDLTNTIIISGEDLVDTNVIGAYDIRYAVEDTSGNFVEEIRTVNVVDPSGPEITLVGAAEITVECGSEFADPGATATDAIDDDLTENIEVRSDDPNMMYLPGVYTVTYSVTNSRDTLAEVVRTVTVGDSVAPAISLRGPAAITIDCGSPLFILDDYAIAEDICDNKPVVSRVGDVDTDTPGTYTVQYSATDTAGNVTQTTLTVTVRDNCSPVDEGELEGEGEGELEGEGEGEPEECTGCRACLGCCPDEEGKWLPKDWLGDWLLIGLSMLVMVAFATSRQPQ